MANFIVLRKRERDGNRVCIDYTIPEPSYKFTFDTCYELTATLKDSSNLTRAVLTQSSPVAVISDAGRYNICIGDGEGTATLYAEWISAGDENCCEEMRQNVTNLQNQINDLRRRITILENQVNGIIDGTITIGCCEELLREINILREIIEQLQNNECCDELRQRIINIENRLNALNVVGGNGISVTKNGDVYTINNTSLGSVTTLVEGNGVRITDSGSGDNHVYTIDNISLGSVTTLVQGTGVTITDSGTGDNHIYTIDNTSLGSVTTLVQGTGVTITDTGTGDNHVYTISATGGGGIDEEIDIVSISPNIIITKEAM